MVRFKDIHTKETIVAIKWIGSLATTLVIFTLSASTTQILNEPSLTTIQAKNTHYTKSHKPSHPRDFRGTIKWVLCTCCCQIKYKMHTHWRRSRSKDVLSYRIYHRKKLLKVIPNTSKFEFDKLLKSDSTHRDFYVSAVNSLGKESSRVRVRLTLD